MLLGVVSSSSILGNALVIPPPDLVFALGLAVRFIPQGRSFLEMEKRKRHVFVFVENEY